jgi:hypothetical protein
MNIELFKIIQQNANGKIEIYPIEAECIVVQLDVNLFYRPAKNILYLTDDEGKVIRSGDEFNYRYYHYRMVKDKVYKMRKSYTYCLADF